MNKKKGIKKYYFLTKLWLIKLHHFSLKMSNTYISVTTWAINLKLTPVKYHHKRSRVVPIKSHTRDQHVFCRPVCKLHLALNIRLIQKYLQSVPQVRSYLWYKFKVHTPATSPDIKFCDNLQTGLQNTRWSRV